METTSASGGALVKDARVWEADDGYDLFLRRLREGCAQVAAPYFTTDAGDLFDVFLSELPKERRQCYTCNACRHFVHRYGGLVVITPEGRTVPVMWDAFDVPVFFKPAVAVMEKRVRSARVTGVFLTSESMLGTPITGEWCHMHASTPQACLYATPLMNANQRMAERREEYAMLQRSLAEFPIGVVEQAQQLLATGNLARSEKHLGMAKWLLDLHRARAGLYAQAKENTVWRAVATAPAGFCHVRAGLIGTLLEDVQAGLSFDAIKRKHDEKMDPTKYLRPQAPPKVGNVAVAEKVVGVLKSSGALSRRFARLDDMQQLLWTPRPLTAKPAQPGGVFGHLVNPPTAAKQIEQPAVTMTLEKFRSTVLADAATIEFDVPAHGNFIALVTAVNPDAPPILQWDRDEQRNPVSWYLYASGSDAYRWNIAPGWCRVTGITLLPSMWHGGNEHQGRGAIFLLDGCRDMNDAGNGLFPEILRSEYHAVRSTIEAYSRGEKLLGRDEASACGYDLRDGSERVWTARMRVTRLDGTQQVYKLDRWD